MRSARVALAFTLTALGCNEGLRPVPALTSCPAGFVGICGTLHFHGALPPTTGDVVLVAYATFPKSRDDLFTFLPFPPQSVLTTDSTRFYTLPVPNGRYEWVVAVWVDSAFTIANADSTLREAGYFRDSADSTKPGAVVVNGVGTDSIDVVVDFTNMHPISYYFPAAARR